MLCSSPCRYQALVSEPLKVLVTIWSVWVNVVQDAIDMESDDGLFAFGGFQKAEAFLAVLKSIFTQNCGASCVSEDCEIRLQVWVAVCIVCSQPVPWQPEVRLSVQAVGQLVGTSLPFAGVGAPAGGVVPAVAMTSRVYVDGDNQDVALAQFAAPRIDSRTPCAQADVVYFGHDALCIVAQVAEVGHDCFGDFPRPGVLTEATVWGAFARCVAAVTVVNQNLCLFHCSWFSGFWLLSFEAESSIEGFEGMAV